MYIAIANRSGIHVLSGWLQSTQICKLVGSNPPEIVRSYYDLRRRLERNATAVGRHAEGKFVAYYEALDALEDASLRRTSVEQADRFFKFNVENNTLRRVGLYLVLPIARIPRL